MKTFGIQLQEGSNISNLSVAAGVAFPSSPNDGELFYRTDADTTVVGLYCYINGSWDRISSADAMTAPKASTLPATATAGDIFYKDSNDGTEGLYVYNGSVWGPIVTSATPGTVTSVSLSVPSFLSVTGSPITSSGTFALSYSGTPLPIANGGTGQTTATAAFNSLAPSQASNSGRFLTTDGTNTSWATTTTGTVTSVAISLPSFLQVTGSPITSSGTFALSYSGTPLPVANGGTGVTTSTGTGSTVLSTSPQLTTPQLGVASADGLVVSLTGAGAATFPLSLKNNSVGSTGAGTGVGLDFWVPANAATPSANIYAVSAAGTTATDLVFSTGAGSAAEKMRLSSTGVATLTGGVASTTTGTGTLVVTGGVGVGGALNANSAKIGPTFTPLTSANLEVAGTSIDTTWSTKNFSTDNGVGVTVRNTSAGDGKYASITLAVPNTATTVQAIDLIAQSTAAGQTPNFVLASRSAAGATTDRLTMNASGNFTVTAATASTTSATGALIVTGGVGIGGALNVAGIIDGASIQATPIGSTTASTGAFTTLTANAGTASTSTTTGTLIVTGGAGVSGAIYAGSLQNTPIGSTTASTGAFTTLSATGLTTLQNGVTAILVGADNGASTKTDLTLKAARLQVPHYLNAESNMSWMSAFSDATNNTLDFGGGSGANNVATQLRFYTGATNITKLGTVAMLINNAQQVSISTATAATSTTTGAFVVTGGAGIGGALYAGSLQNTPIGTTTASSGAFTTLTASAGTASTSTTTGTLIVTGGVGVSGAINASTVVTTGGVTAGGTISTGTLGGTIGTSGITTGDTTHSGFVLFNSAAGVRQGFIGFSTTNAAANAGTIPYVAGTHAFTGDITATGAITAAQASAAYATYSVAPATFVPITISTGSTALVNGSAYRIHLVTTGTSVATGSTYIAYQTAAGVWALWNSSNTGLPAGGNQPQLRVTGTTLEVFTSHATLTYTISVRLETWVVGNTTIFDPAVFGVDGAITTSGDTILIGGVNTTPIGTEVLTATKTSAGAISVPVYVQNAGTTTGTGVGIGLVTNSKSSTAVSLGQITAVATDALGAGDVIIGSNASGGTSPTDRLKVASTGVVSVLSSTASTTSATGALVVAGGVGVGGDSTFGGNVTLSRTSSTTVARGDTSSFLAITGGINASDGKNIILGGTTHATFGHQLQIRDGTAIALAVDASNNLGVGVTPNAWGTSGSAKALEFTAGGLLSWSTSEWHSAQNAFWNGTNWTLKTAAVASEIALTSGGMKFNYAPTGTAGQTFAWSEGMFMSTTGLVTIGGGAHGASPLNVNSITGGAGATGTIQILDTTSVGPTVPPVGLYMNRASGVSGSTSPSIFFDVGTGGGSCQIYSIREGGPGGNLVIATETTGGVMTERIHVSSIGNVGIGTGTTAATTKLQVANNANSTTAITVTNTDVGASADARIQLSNGTNLGASFILRGSGHTSEANHLLISSGGAYPLNFYTNGNSRGKLLSAGQFVMGGSAVTAQSGLVTASLIAPTIQTVSTTTADGLMTTRYSTTAAAMNGIILAKSANGTIDTFTTAVPINASLGYISWNGSDTVKLAEAARITVETEAAALTDNIPSRMVFSTSSSGTATPTAKMTISAAGAVGIGMTPSATYHLGVAKSDATVYASSGATALPAGGALINIDNATTPSGVDGNWSGLVFAAKNTLGVSNISYIGNVSANGASGGTMVFGQRTASAAYAEAMRINTSGNLIVGGTTSTGEKVRINQSSTAAATQLKLSNSTDTSYSMLQFVGSTFATATRQNNTELVTNGATSDFTVLINGTEQTRTSGAGLTVSVNDLIVPKTSGKGIKVDPAAPTFPFHDIMGPLVLRGIGVDPTWNVFRGNLRAYQFTVNDYVEFFYHLPHDYAPGTDIYGHVHWSHASAAVTTGATTWEFISSYAKGHNQAAFPAEVTTTVTQNASTVQYQHMVAETVLSVAGGSATLLNSTNFEPDGIIIMRVRLTANTMNGTPEPFVFTCDLHYQSTNIGTKQKSPNFYV